VLSVLALVVDFWACAAAARSRTSETEVLEAPEKPIAGCRRDSLMFVWFAKASRCARVYVCDRESV